MTDSPTRRTPAHAPADRAALQAVGHAAWGYDTVLYALAALLVFPGLVFRPLGLAGGLLASLALLAGGLALRPLGARLGRALAARHGSVLSVTAASLVLAAMSCLTGLLPGGGSAQTPSGNDGWALAWAGLVACRLLQGLASGACSPAGMKQPGAGDSSGVAGRPGRWAWQACALSPGRLTGVLLGAIVAGALMAGLRAGLSADEFLAWGWRFPFVIGLAVQAVALVARLQLLPVSRSTAKATARATQPGPPPWASAAATLMPAPPPMPPLPARLSWLNPRH